VSLNANSFNAEEILAGILSWVRQESPTFDAAAVNAMMDIAIRDLATVNARIERMPGREGFGDVVRATISGRRDGPGILVLGHLDTVHPVGTIETTLKIRREGDKVFGPGIYDMKGGLYLALYALRQILRAGDQPELGVTFLLIPDEEVGSPSTRALIEAESARHRYVLVLEPSRGGKVTTGRHAFLRYKIHVLGRPAHAGADNRKGRSAIRAMARLVERIESFSDLERGRSYAVGVIRGGQWVNVIPIECHAEVLCVAPSEEDFLIVQRDMASLADEADGVRVEIEPGPIRPLFKPHAATMAVYERARAIAAEHGYTLDHGQFGGGSDGNFAGALGAATLDGLGVMGDGPHTHEEHLLISSLEPRARLIAGLFETLR
jgi:glutamate carboxypeptidase